MPPMSTTVKIVSNVATTASTGEMKKSRFSNIFRGSVMSERLARKKETVASSGRGSLT